MAQPSPDTYVLKGKGMSSRITSPVFTRRKKKPLKMLQTRIDADLHATVYAEIRRQKIFVRDVVEWALRSFLRKAPKNEGVTFEPKAAPTSIDTDADGEPPPSGVRQSEPEPEAPPAAGAL